MAGIERFRILRGAGRTRLFGERGQRSSAYFDAAPCALVIADWHGLITQVNEDARRLFGYERADLIGSRLDRVLPGFVTGTPAARRRSAHGRRRDGTDFPAELSVNRSRDGMTVVAVRDVTDLTLAAEALVHQASHDPLTSLPNRALFLDRLEHALARARRSRRKLAVVFVDLDDFKLVNDTQGHEAGDELLLDLAPRLTAALRPGDTIARFGGDEFVVLCEDLDDDADVVSIARRILDACSSPLAAGEGQHCISASAGIAMLQDMDATTASALLRHADVAMYRAKERGKGRIEVFDERMRARVLDEVAIETELERALERGEFRLAYQPILSTSDCTLTGVEALLRWEHPRRGLLVASEFISVADRTGMIVPIGQRALEEACRQAASWNALDPDREPIFVTVNMSLPQVTREGVLDEVGPILQRTGLHPSLLKLEVAERSLLQASDYAAGLHRLRELGVGLIVDDFGTDVSSLSLLTRLDVDGLKIDRVLIARMEESSDDHAVISAVLGLADALELAVFAEGVESVTQLEHLRSQGCTYAQGQWLARPVSAAQLRRLVSERWAADYALVR